MKNILKKILGVVFIILGFLALITPFTPGSWLILIGLELVGLRILLAGKLRPLTKGKWGGRFQSFVRRIARKPPSKASEAKPVNKDPEAK